MIVVSDTSPLSALAIVGQLSLLHTLYGQLIIPTAVADELRRGGQDDPRIAQILTLSWLKVKPPSDARLVNELQTVYRLDRGESEAIALALELNADELLIDERLGRREASRLGLSITGLLGVLLVAKNRSLVSAVRPIVDALINEAGFRISNQLYIEVLTVAGELSE